MSDLADRLRGKKRFLHAKNRYEDGPGPSAIAFTVDPKWTLYDNAVTVLVEGPDWFTHLSFYRDQGTMRIYPDGSTEVAQAGAANQEKLDELAELLGTDADIEWIIAYAKNMIAEAVAAALREWAAKNAQAVDEAVAAERDNPKSELAVATRLLTWIDAYWDEPGVTQPALATHVALFLEGHWEEAEPNRVFTTEDLAAIRARG